MLPPKKASACIPESLRINAWFLPGHIDRKLRYAIALLFVSTLAHSQGDKLLNIMQRELNREVAEFTKVSQPPYFIAYRADDEESASVNSSFGSLTQSDVNHHRSLFTTVRIGDYLVDNTHPVEAGKMSFPGYSNIQSADLPLDDNEEVIATRMWSATDNEYRTALREYNNVKNVIATRKKDEKSIPDFSREAVEKYYEDPLPKLADIFIKEQWEQKTRQYSKLFLGEASIVSADVSLQVTNDRRYYVSSEGASVVQNFGGAYLYVIASIRATDGEVIPLHRSYYAPTPAELPGDETIANDIKEMIVTLQKLKTAPMADPYTGPALLDGPVAGVFFHEIFGHRVEGHRLRSELDGQTFKSKVNDKILPDYMGVYCDPTLKQFGGKYLNGVYGYDDEGVKSKRVSIVQNGVLKNFLMSRTPLEDFTHSNGHARATAALMPVSRQSNLFVDAAKTKSSSELRQMLIRECKKQKKPYGYFFKSVVGGFTTTDRYSPNAFNIFPTEVYKIYVDGRPDELVRGVDLIGTPLAMFAEISAVGDTHGVFVGFCGAESGYVPVSAVSPALFVRRIETQKKPKNKVEETVLRAPVMPSNK
jgi:TldD protein